MRLKKKHKPSFHKANARYRGVTELNQYTNFVLESAHDLLLLSHITTGNEATSIKGHKKEMYENFVSVTTGDSGVGKANVHTASTLKRINHSLNVDVPKDLGDWIPLNGCEINKAGGGYRLSSNAWDDTIGMYATLFAEPGEKFYIRLKAKSATGASDFSFGSNNIRTGPQTKGDTRKVSLEAGADYVTLDYVITAKYTEAIHININVHQDPEFLKETTVDIKDLEVYYIEERPIHLSSLDGLVKPKLDEIEEQINSIR